MLMKMQMELLQQGVQNDQLPSQYEVVIGLFCTLEKVSKFYQIQQKVLLEYMAMNRFRQLKEEEKKKKSTEEVQILASVADSEDGSDGETKVGVNLNFKF